MANTVGFWKKTTITITLCNAYFIFCIESFLFILFLLNFLLLGWRFCGGGGNCGSNGRGNECCHCTSTVSVALLPLCRAVTVFMVHFYDLGKSPFQKLPVLDMKFGKISHSAPVYTIQYPKHRNCCLFLLFNHYLDLPESDNNIVLENTATDDMFFTGMSVGQRFNTKNLDRMAPRMLHHITSDTSMESSNNVLFHCVFY